MMGERVRVQAKTPEAKRENSVFQTLKPDPSQSVNALVDRASFPQRTLGDEAIGRVSQANSWINRPPDQLPSPLFTPRFNHDFSRIPVHAHALGTIQPKLIIGQPNDKYEQEADQIADQVMSAPQEARLGWMEEPECSECEGDEEVIQTQSIADHITPLVQRDVESEEEEIPEEEEEEKEEKAKEPVQFKANPARSPKIPPNLEPGIQSLRGGGQPLPESTRNYFESRFGYDFSHVKVHANSNAAHVAKSMNARAFTLGNNIVFNAAEFFPTTSNGTKLIAHELTHVIQQGASSSKIPYIQRKIKAVGYPLYYYLKSKGITSYSKVGNVYSINRYNVHPLRKKQILIDLLASERVFPVPGASALAVRKNLEDHIKARINVVQLAGKGRFTFAAGSKVITQHWVTTKSGRLKAPVSWKDFFDPSRAQLRASRKTFRDPQSAIDCELAAFVTFTTATGKARFHQLNTSNYNDWIPGDWGYIENPGFVQGKSPAGTMGQHVIKVFDYDWWGHPAGKMTWKEWQTYIFNWNKDLLHCKQDKTKCIPTTKNIKDWRRFPVAGLE